MIYFDIVVLQGSFRILLTVGKVEVDLRDISTGAFCGSNNISNLLK
jgi:hypothetical protein